MNFFQKMKYQDEKTNLKNRKVLNSLIAISVIITLTLYYFLFVGVTTVSYAAGAVGGNIDFEAYFKDSEGNNLTTMAATTTDEIYLYLYVEVLKEGYFNGEIKIGDGNFDIDSEIVDEKISSIEDNTITINQVNNGEPQEFKVKINRKTAQEYDLNLLEKETKITLSGVYANSKKEKAVEEDIEVKLIYESPYVQGESTVTLSVITNKLEEIDGEEKRILQILVTSSLEGNNYPVEKTNITLSAPNGAENVYVYTRGTSLTNGKSSSEGLAENSYTYNKETNTVEIKIANEIQETENEEKKVTWKDSGTDKILVTYILPESSALEQTINVTSQISLYDGYIENHETTVLNATSTIKTEEEINGIITAQVVTEDESIYKGKIYSGEEKEISTITKLGINYTGIENQITLEGITTNYEQLAEDEQTGETYIASTLSENMKTSKTSIQRDYLEKVLGENGILTIKVGDIELGYINKAVLEVLDQYEEGTTVRQTDYAKMQLNDGAIEIVYDLDKQYRVDLEIENPEQEGELYITNTYSILNEYSRNELQNMNNLKIESTLETEARTENIETNIELEETTINANFKIVNNTLNENKLTKDVEFLVLLRNDSEEDDLYLKPYIEIELPEEIKEISIQSVNLVYEDGLSISNYEIYENEQGKQIIRVELEGCQTTHQIDTETKGTYIVINTNIILGEIEESKETDVNLTVVNRQDGITYTKELQKTIKYIKEVEEIQTTGITATTTAVVASALEGIEANGTLTVLKTASVEEGETVKEREIIKYTISVRNNTTSTLENITITDELPEEVTYVRYNTGGGFSNGYVEDTETTVYEKTGISIESGETAEYEYCVIVNKDSNNVGQDLVSKEATITVPDTGEEFTTNTYTNTIEEGKVEISIACTSNIMSYFNPGMTVGYIIKVKNLTDNELTDVVIKDQLIEELTYKEGYILGKDSNGSFGIFADDTTQDNITYNEGTKTVEFNIETLSAEEEKAVYITVTINDDATSKYLENTAFVEIDGETYTAYTETVRQEIESYEISATNSVEGTYITEGDTFVYTVTLKNLGDITTSGALSAELPDGITGEALYYSIETGDTSSTLDRANHTDVIDLSSAYTDLLNGITTESEENESEETEGTIYNQNKVYFLTGLEKNSILTARIYVTADMLEDGVEEKEITTSFSFGEQTSNELYNVIILSDRSGDEDDGEEDNNQEEENTNTYVDDSDSYTRPSRPTSNNTTNETTNNTANETTGNTTNNTTNNTNTNTNKENNTTNKTNTSVENLIIEPVNTTTKNNTNNVEIQRGNNTTDNITEENYTVEIRKDNTTGENYTVEIRTDNTTGGNYIVEIKRDNTVAEENESIEIKRSDSTTEENTVATTGNDTTTSGNKTTNSGSTTTTENTFTTTAKYSTISGQVWLDINTNGKKDSSEVKLEDIKVKLFNNLTNKYVSTTVTDSNGYYEFTNLSSGSYIVVFEYDKTKYKLTEYQKSGVSEDSNSDVVTSIENDGIGYTDTITVYEEEKENIDMGLIYSGTFDLRLDKTITSISVTNDSGSKTTEYDNTSLAKVEISSKLLSSSTVVITYQITVTNEGEITGYVDKIVDYLPDGLTFNSSMNSDWYQSDGVLISNSLSGQAIAAGESKTIELVLVKTMTTSNTGTVSNSAEIMETSNSESIDDEDSTPNNKVISEDDYSTANVIISVSTGRIAKYISITSLIIIIIATAILIISTKMQKGSFANWKERRR